MLNLGGGVQRQQTTAGMDSNMRMNWTRLRDGDLSVKKFKKMKEGDSSAWGKASAIVHTTAEQALAFVWFYCSNLRMKEHQKKDGNLIRQVYEPVATDTTAATDTVLPVQHRTQHIVVQKSMPTPFQTRETNMRYVWGEMNTENEEDSKTLIMAFEPAEINHISEWWGFRRRTAKLISRRHLLSSLSGSLSSKNPFIAKKISSRKNDSSVHPVINDGEEEQSLGVVQLESRGVWVIKPLAQDLCEVMFVVNIADKGKIPTSLINANIGRAFDVVTIFKTFYERNGRTVDAEVSERASARNSESRAQAERGGGGSPPLHNK